MKLFKDTEGREWQIKVNVATIKRVRDLLDVDLLESVESETMHALMTDPIMLVNVVYVICKPEADERGVTDEQFGEAMGGDSIDQATKGFLEDLCDFFPEPRRGLLKKAVLKMDAMMTHMMEAGHQYLDSPQLEKQLKDQIAGELSGKQQGS